jgi:hypothetical protein
VVSKREIACRRLLGFLLAADISLEKHRAMDLPIKPPRQWFALFVYPSEPNESHARTPRFYKVQVKIGRHLRS